MAIHARVGTTRAGERALEPMCRPSSSLVHLAASRQLPLEGGGRGQEEGRVHGTGTGISFMRMTTLDSEKDWFLWERLWMPTLLPLNN